MRKIILVLFLLFPVSLYAGVIGGGTEKTTSVFGGKNSGNQTIVNVQKEQPDPDLMPNEDKSYKESKITLTVDAAAYVFPFGYAERQFSQETFALGAMWKVDGHWQGVVKYMNLNLEFADGERYTAKHYMYGIGLRWTAGNGEHQIQLNAGSSNSEVEWKGEGSYDTPVWAEAKYLWCADNTAYGVILSFMDMPKKAEENEQFENAGAAVVAFTFEVGIADLL